MRCKNCQKEFQNKRKTARFCSATCRKDFWRKKDSVAVSVPKRGDSVTKPVSVTKRKYQGSYLYQLCPKHPGSMKITCGCK